MKRYLVAILLFLPLLVSAGHKHPVLLKDDVIWQSGDYAAFTSLIHYKGYFYCAFRTANGHSHKKVSDNGTITMIKSKNGAEWSKFIELKQENVDLRDPKLTVAPDGRMMLSCGGTVYSGEKASFCCTRVCFIKKDGSFTPFEDVTIDSRTSSNWIWRIVWHKGTAYGFNYVGEFALVKSTDGIHYSTVKKDFYFEKRPTEADLVFSRNGDVTAVLRNENCTQIGVGRIDGNIKWHRIYIKIGGPAIISHKGDLLVGGRLYFDGKPTMTLSKLDIKNYNMTPILQYPSLSDNSYPGLVCMGGKLYLSYYNGDGKKSSIFFSKVKL